MAKTEEIDDRCHGRPKHPNDLVSHRQIVAAAVGRGLIKADDRILLHGAKHARHATRVVASKYSVVNGE